MAEISPIPKVPSQFEIKNGIDPTKVQIPPVITDSQQDKYFSTKLTTDDLQTLIFQNIGGRELSILARHDNINGIEQSYSPIKNVSDIALEYNPVKLAYNPNSVTDFLDTFRYSFNRYVPTQEDLELFYEAQNATVQELVYFDKDTNSLVIHVANVTGGELVDVEFVAYTSVKDQTEYA